MTIRARDSRTSALVVGVPLLLLILAQLVAAVSETTLLWSGQAGRIGPRSKSDLLAGGGQVLSTEEVRELVFGKTLRITNLATGDKYDVFFGEDGTRTVISTVSTVTLQGNQPDESAYEVRDGKLYTTLLDGSRFSTQVYRWGQRYFASRGDDNEYLDYELLGVIEGRVTVASLMSRGAVALTNEELERLLVGKTLTIRHLVTGEVFQISYSKKGRRTLKSRADQEDAVDSTYKIREGRLDIWEDGSFLYARIYRFGDLYFGARSNEQGFVSYEILSSR